MRAETELIWKLVGKLLDEATSVVIVDTTEGRAPKAIASRVANYQYSSLEGPLWKNADYDILVLIAMGDLMWDRIQPLSNKDEAALEMALGANALSQPATIAALARMRTELRELSVLKTQCEAMPAIAWAVVGKSAMLGPANASQIAFDKMGADKVRKDCDRNKQHLVDILAKLQHVIPVTEQTLRAHQRR